jgi:hypothetical protein
MSRYNFAVSGLESRQEGVIECESFRAAVDALGQHVDVRMGDVLEIGVLGFPPARYECVGEIRSGLPLWMPSGLRAA